MRDIRGETLYFVILDRFSDGDTTSNEGRNPASFDPERRDWLRYWGGDLQGVIDRLGYLERIGVTTIVLTPVVEQMPSLGRDRGALAAPWLGQWALDYRRLDPHLIPRTEWDRPFGARDTVFDRLVQECHDRGMQLVMQLCVGHSNPGGTDNPRGELHDDGRWLLSFEHDPNGWYRHGLGRENAESGPAVFEPASGAFRGWLRSVLLDWLDRGLDGFYFDTANQMPIWFWQETSSSLNQARAGSLLIGGWNGRGWDDVSVRYANRSGMRMVDFEFARQVTEAMCWGEVGGFRRIASYLERDEQLDDASSLVTSLDTGCGAKLGATGLSGDDLRIGMALLMTSRGVPWILYGTEQGLKPDHEDGIEPYDKPMMQRFEPSATTEAMYKLALLRKENLAVQRGLYRTLWLSEEVFAYSREHASDAIVVVLNRGRELMLDLAEVPLPDGPVFDVLGGGGVVVNGRRVERLRVPARSAVVLARTTPKESAGNLVLCRLSGYRSRFGESVVLTGDAPELGEWDLQRAIPLQYANANLWMGDAHFGPSVGKLVLYKYAVIDGKGGVTREDRLPRRRLVPDCKGLEWADRWQTEG